MENSKCQDDDKNIKSNMESSNWSALSYRNRPSEYVDHLIFFLQKTKKKFCGNSFNIFMLFFPMKNVTAKIILLPFILRTETIWQKIKQNSSLQGAILHMMQFIFMLAMDAVLHNNWKYNNVKCQLHFELLQNYEAVRKICLFLPILNQTVPEKL